MSKIGSGTSYTLVCAVLLCQLVSSGSRALWCQGWYTLGSSLTEKSYITTLAENLSFGNMNWSRLWYIVSLFAIVGLIFLTGYFVGNRTWYISKPDEIVVKNGNGVEKTTLSDITFRNLNARTDGKNVVRAGELLYRTNGAELEIMLRITNLPLQFGVSEGSIAYPQSYTVNLAKRSLDGLNYELTPIGTLALDVPQKGVYSGGFGTKLAYNKLQFENQFERILLTNDTVPQLPAYDYAAFASEYRAKPSPFVWSE